jgi:secernin
MDLVRLGLERGATARAALEVMTGLLEAHGQGGACAEGDPGFAYHNGFLIADPREAWVLETAGRHWAAQRIVRGTRNISNALTIRKDYDLCSAGVAAHGRTDFTAAFSTAPADPPAGSRQACGARLLARHAGRITPDAMMAILRDHDSGICMHGMVATTASMVSRLAGPDGHEHWATGRPYPCANRFVPLGVVESVAVPVPTSAPA